MTQSSEQSGSVYIYALVQNHGPETLGAIGIDGAEVRRIAVGELAAFISRIARPRIRPERRNLAAHNAVLKQAMESGTVLPVAFGIIAQNEDAVRVALLTNQPDLQAQFAKVANKVEMGLRVLWDVPNVFEYFVGVHPELRAARDALSDPRQPRRDEMIELGQLFDRILNFERERHFERISELFEKLGFETLRNATRSEREVLNLACLISRAAQTDFENAVTAAAADFDNNYTFDFNGPWAPHHFVALNLKL